MRAYEPSPRDLEIYDSVKQGDQTQREVAKTHRIDQSRVCRICQQVERWIASYGPDPELTEAERLFVTAYNQVDRLRLLCRQAQTAFDETRQPHSSGVIRPSAPLFQKLIACHKELFNAECVLVKAEAACQAQRRAQLSSNQADPPAAEQALPAAESDEAAAAATTCAASPDVDRAASSDDAIYHQTVPSKPAGNEKFGCISFPLPGTSFKPMRLTKAPRRR